LGWWHSQYMENKTCSKPPIRWWFMVFYGFSISLCEFTPIFVIHWYRPTCPVAGTLESPIWLPNLGCWQATHSASWARCMLLASPLTLGPPAIQINPQWTFCRGVSRILESY
jgi:hypothetical protein